MSSYTPSPAFETAKANVDKLTKSQSQAIMLLAYALYKQTTVGDVNVPAPSIFDPRGKVKHTAWTYAHGISREAADAQYVNCSEHMVGGTPLNEANEELLGKIRGSNFF
ncbi:acyl-CoA binding protein [Choiromyces venosus 120613-1]|uniref:Acyl-CoA binding protein n=1 Tax=Choiromyces venosus 120613-1 TaxID=1336337 RepID=A0A3N4J2U0_9PEZI|nr:acyl-CoA binding protein [Choiromyces venosus 120613-1]